MGKDTLLSLLSAFFRALNFDLGLGNRLLAPTFLIPVRALGRILVEVDLHVQALPDLVDVRTLRANDTANVFLRDGELDNVAVVDLVLFSVRDDLVDLLNSPLDLISRAADEDLVLLELLAA